MFPNFQRISDGFAAAHARRALETGDEVMDKGGNKGGTNSLNFEKDLQKPQLSYLFS